MSHELYQQWRRRPRIKGPFFQQLDEFRGVVPRSQLFCQNCNEEQPAFQVGQLKPYQYTYQPPLTTVCAVCGWYYYRRAINKAVRATVYALDNYECVYCSSQEWLGLDHVVPLTRGGGDDVSNLVTACHSCNASQKDRREKAPMLFGRYREGGAA